MRHSHYHYIRRDTRPEFRGGPRNMARSIPDPTTTAVMGMAFGTACAVWMILLGWAPLIHAPGFSAMVSAGLCSLIGGGLGMLLAHHRKLRRRH